MYSASANAFDSLGEIYAELGNTSLAIKNYEQSFKLNPKNSNAEDQIKILIAKRWKSYSFRHNIQFVIL